MKQSKTLEGILGGVIILLGLFLRVFRLDADVPWDLTWSQGVLTDGPWYVDTAISKIRHVPALMQDKLHHQEIFTYYAYAIFKLFGIGWKQLNFISVIPGILSAVLLGLLFNTVKRPGTRLLALLLLSVNFFFIFYNRTPKIYTLLACGFLLCIWIWQLGAKKKIYFYLSYLLILFLADYLKSFIIILLPILGFLQWRYFSKFKMTFKKISLAKAMATGLVGIVLLAALGWLLKDYYVLVIGKFAAYRLRANAPGTISARIPQSNWYYIYSKMFLETLLAYVGFLFVLYRQTGGSKIGRVLDIVSCIILIVGNFGFFLFQYYPPRFYVFMLPFLCYLAAVSVFELLKASPPNEMRRRKFVPFLVALWIGFLLYHVVCVLFPALTEAHLLLTLLILSASALGIGKYLHEQVFLKKKLICRPTLIYLLVFMAVFSQIVRYLAWTLKPEYSTKIAIAETKILLPPTACVTGPYAHLLGLTSDFKKIWLGFAKNETESSLITLERNGVTHLAIDVAATLEDIKTFHPELLDHLLPVTSVFMHGFEIQIFRYISPGGASKDVSDLAPNEIVAYEMNEKNYGQKVQKEIAALPEEIGKLSQIQHWQGMLEMAIGDPNKGVEIFKQVLEKNPYFAPSAYQLATYNLEKGDSATAGRYLEQAARMVERTPTTLATLSNDWRKRTEGLQKKVP